LLGGGGGSAATGYPIDVLGRSRTCPSRGIFCATANPVEAISPRQKGSRDYWRGGRASAKGVESEDDARPREVLSQDRLQNDDVSTELQTKIGVRKQASRRAGDCGDGGRSAMLGAAGKMGPTSGPRARRAAKWRREKNAIVCVARFPLQVRGSFLEAKRRRDHRGGCCSSRALAALPGPGRT